MSVLTTILPVFFMIILGGVSKKKNLITNEQANGMSDVVYKLLMPIMVFNAIFTTNLKVSALYIVLFVFFIHIFGLVIGKLTSRFIGGRFSNISPYLMCTVDGGNVCFPLYATIVGASYISNIVLLDIACMFIVFLIIPLTVSTTNSKSSNIKDMLKNIFYNPIVISLLVGFILNQIGLYDYITNSSINDAYNSIISMATAPIVTMILFMIGYQFKIEKSSIVPLVKCVMSRFIIMAIAIISFFTVFPKLLQDRALFIAVILYFMCPPSLILQTQVSSLFTKEEDASFMSAFVSVYMIITLIAYMLIVILC